jgi:crotonobetainyl-CoA:carnitine CoA-transferase CaiB-like acyl-CoA transferase
MSPRALSGVRVLDVATLFPAPLLAAMLGDYGADVVKVEPANGDPLRAIGDVPWAVAGRNKRSLLIDFDTADGLALLRDLIAVADVVIFNQPNHVLERWGCTDDAITALNARAIVVHVTAFGMTGPYANRAGNGTLAESFVGIPMTSVPLGDTVGAITGVAGVLSALYWRDARDGHGQVVDVSLYESLLPLLAPAIAGLSGTRSFREALTAADGKQVVISATTDAQLARLHEVASDNVESWVAARDAVEAVQVLIDARVPAVVVNDRTSLLDDPHVVARGSVHSVDGTTLPSPAPRLDTTPGTVTHLGPALGEHTDEVVAEWLHGNGHGSRGTT